MNRKRRYLISAAVLAACVCIALGIVALMPQQPGVTKTNFDRIEVGMTRAEIDAILGEANGSETSRRTRTWLHVDGAQVNAWFDDDAKVFDMEFQPSTESLTDKVLRWLGMQPRLETRSRQL